MVAPRARSLVAAAAVTLAPALCAACPYCAGSRDNQPMYLVATALLLGTPVALVLGLLRWLRGYAPSPSPRRAAR
ncbi:MAG: hypothetical protein HY909_10310 [Deltaproteobacteria bacterium]|nr:hypothetical protein [Deltaproteobacteria bacterium]